MNPFSITFGQTPIEPVKRAKEMIEIADAFTAPNPFSHVYVITGVRGTGKTVLLTDISKSFKEKKDWLVVGLNPEKDMLTSLVAKIHDEGIMHGLNKDTSISLSFAGIGASITQSDKMIDIESTLFEMLKGLKKKKRKLLITIDEVTSNEHMKIFASSFQMMLREDFDVFLLMTGLYENIRNLQDKPSLTFLYRSPKVALGALDLDAIRSNYQRLLKLTEENAIKAAKHTGGYAFAYQVLGYLLYEADDKTIAKSTLEKYDYYLGQLAYDKIWSETSDTDKKLLALIANSKTNSTKEICEDPDFPKNKLSVYRERLLQKGLVDVSKRGYIKLVLPRFKEFIQKKLLYDEL